MIVRAITAPKLEIEFENPKTYSGQAANTALSINAFVFGENGLV